MYIEMNAKDYIDTMMFDPPPAPPERSESSRRRISSSDANEQSEPVNTQLSCSVLTVSRVFPKVSSIEPFTTYSVSN